jgi:hypothetical protein
MEEVAELHKALLQNDFRGCFDAWKTHMEQYVTGDGNYCEGNEGSIIAILKYILNWSLYLVATTCICSGS